MEKYQYIQQFHVGHSDIDFKDEMKLSSVVSKMGEAASDSAEELGFGYSYLKDKPYTFMVANTTMLYIKPLRFDEIIQLRTWPLAPTYVTFERHYAFEDLSGDTRVLAVSRWCLVDFVSGKILPSKTIDNQNYATYNTDVVLSDINWKIPGVECGNEELCYIVTVANSDYDHNMHVNNARYADYCLNCFSVAELKASRLKQFSISYIKQSHEGDVLRLYRAKIDENAYAIQAVNQNNQVVVRAKFVFEV